MDMTSRGATAGRWAALALVGAGLAACANPRADQALFAQQAFVGMPKQTLLSCAGVPERQATVDNLTYYTYTSERITTTPAPAFGHGPWWDPWYGWGPGWGGYGDVESRSCQATFTLENDVVRQVVYNSASDGPSGRLGQCYQIVENCLALIPQQTAVVR